MDRETVITHLQIISTWASFAREHDLQFFTEKHLEDIAQWTKDALKLLKEQEEQIKTRDESLEKAREEIKWLRGMLEEQKVKEGHWIVLDFCANEGIYCSECHMKIFDRTTKPKKKLSQYCPHCGSRNDQFFRNGEIVFR